MKTLLPFLGLLICTASYGQKKAYLVKHNGDTLYGNIELHNKVFFVSNAPGKDIQLDAADVKKINSDDFKGSIVVPCFLHTYIDELTELMSGTFKSSTLDTVMVLQEVYTTPRMNLYFGKDYLRRQYYFFKTPGDSLPIQLYINYTISGVNRQNLTFVIGNLASAMHVEVQKGYVNQLRQIMGDCKKISDGDWDQLDYRVYSLKSVIKKYNKCK